MLTLIIFTLMSLTKAAIYKDGPCPHVQPVKYFNLTAYGYSIWYELAKYPNDLENKGDCTYIVFKEENGVIKFLLGEVAEKHFDSIDGYVNYAPNAGTSGFLFFESLNFVEKEKSSIMPVYVLTVDYSRYFITYECKYDEATNKRHEFAWVQSRTKTLDAETKAYIDNFLKSSPLIDAEKLTWNKFDLKTCEIVN